MRQVVAKTVLGTVRMARDRLGPPRRSRVPVWHLVGWDGMADMAEHGHKVARTRSDHGEWAMGSHWRWQTRIALVLYYEASPHRIGCWVIRDSRGH